MKNLLKIALCGFAVILLTTAVLSVHARQSYEHNKVEKKHVSQADHATFVASDFGYTIGPAVLADEVVLPVDRSVIYLKPVNDPKPDNTNVQIWRKNILNLRTSIQSC